MSSLRVALFAQLVVAIAIVPSELHGQSTLIPLATRRAMVFDHAGKYLYIGTSDGRVRAYNLATHKLETSFNLGGSLNAIDISPDDSFLLAAQNNFSWPQGICHRMDLNSRAISNISFTLQDGEAAPWDVSIASNGRAFVTLQYSGSGAIIVRQINLNSNAVSERTDVPRSAVWQNSEIHRSADHRRLYFVVTEESNGPVFTYDATTDLFGPEVDTNSLLLGAGMAVNRDGTLLASCYLGFVTIDRAADFTFLASLNDLDGGVVFDAKSPLLYAVNSALGQIIAYDTNTFAEKFRLNIGETIEAGVLSFGTGTLVAMAITLR
jgi:outer membrane protein assembly factor BamB